MLHKNPEFFPNEEDLSNPLFNFAAEKEGDISKPFFAQPKTKVLYQATKSIFKFAKLKNFAAIEQIYNQCADIDVVNIALACAINGHFSSVEKAIKTLSCFTSKELRTKIAEIIDDPKNNGLVGELSFKLKPLLQQASELQGTIAAYNFFRTPATPRPPKPYERKTPQAKL